MCIRDSSEESCEKTNISPRIKLVYKHEAGVIPFRVMMEVLVVVKILRSLTLPLDDKKINLPFKVLFLYALQMPSFELFCILFCHLERSEWFRA